VTCSALASDTTQQSNERARLRLPRSRRYGRHSNRLLPPLKIGRAARLFLLERGDAFHTVTTSKGVLHERGCTERLCGIMGCAHCTHIGYALNPSCDPLSVKILHERMQSSGSGESSAVPCDAGTLREVARDPSAATPGMCGSMDSTARVSRGRRSLEPISKRHERPRVAFRGAQDPQCMWKYTRNPRTAETHPRSARVYLRARSSFEIGSRSDTSSSTRSDRRHDRPVLPRRHSIRRRRSQSRHRSRSHHLRRRRS
jgi:hypothetical protein